MMRTLIRLLCGITMALAAYAGQAGYSGENYPQADPVRELRLKEVDGYILFYQAIPAQQEKADPAGDARRMPRLLLRVENPAGELVSSARVRFTVEAPGGRRIQALAQPERKGFAADVGWERPGDYQVLAEVAVGSVEFADTFRCRIN